MKNSSNKNFGILFFINKETGKKQKKENYPVIITTPKP